MSTSLAKSWQVLAYLAGAEGPSTVRDVARGTGLPKSTVHRLAAELQQVGAVETEPDGYRLGLRLFELGGIALRQRRLEDEARPHLEALVERTHLLTQLGVLLGHDVLYLSRIGRQGHQRVASPVAGRVPASCTALGKALLAFNPVALAEVLRAGLPRRTRNSITDAGVFRSELMRIRSSSIAVEHEEARLGLACVASPVIVDRRAVAAISVTGSAGGFDLDATGPAVRRAAQALSRQLSVGNLRAPLPRS